MLENFIDSFQFKINLQGFDVEGLIIHNKNLIPDGRAWLPYAEGIFRSSHRVVYAFVHLLGETQLDLTHTLFHCFV